MKRSKSEWEMEKDFSDRFTTIEKFNFYTISAFVASSTASVELRFGSQRRKVTRQNVTYSQCKKQILQ